MPAPPTRTASLTPFECYMFHEQNAQQPMSFCVRVQLTARLDEHRLRQAFAHTLSQHPLLSAKVAVDGPGRPRWVHAAAPADLGRGEDRPQRQVIDLTEGAGLRYWLTETKGAPVLWLEVHHACCDGLGLWRFVRDVAGHYSLDTDAAAVGEVTRDWPSRGPTQLGWPRLRQLQRLLRFARRRQVACFGDRAMREAWQRDFVVRETEVPRGRSGERQTVNDRLLAAAFSALAPAAQEQEVVRLCVPVNLRAYSEVPDVVANCVSMVFLDRALPMDRYANLLPGVAEEMREIKQHRIGASMHHVLAARRGQFRVPKGRTMATAVLSNLGRLWETPADVRFGDVGIRAVSLLPPIRQYTHLALGVTSIGARLHLAAHFNAGALARNDVEQVLDTIVAHVGS